nr:hypothetical protein CparaKRNrm1_p036 [Cryptomonas paramecium]
MKNLLKRIAANRKTYEFFIYCIFKKKCFFFKYTIYKKFYISYEIFLKKNTKKIYGKFIYNAWALLLKKFIIKRIYSKKKLFDNQQFFDYTKIYCFFFYIYTNLLKKNCFTWTKIFAYFFLLQVSLNFELNKIFPDCNFPKHFYLKKKLSPEKLSLFHNQIKVQLVLVCLNYNNLNTSLRFFTKNNQRIFKLVKISIF